MATSVSVVVQLRAMVEGGDEALLITEIKTEI